MGRYSFFFFLSLRRNNSIQPDTSESFCTLSSKVGSHACSQPHHSHLNTRQTPWVSRFWFGPPLPHLELDMGWATSIADKRGYATSMNSGHSKLSSHLGDLADINHHLDLGLQQMVSARGWGWSSAQHAISRLPCPFPHYYCCMT